MEVAKFMSITNTFSPREFEPMFSSFFSNDLQILKLFYLGSRGGGPSTSRSHTFSSENPVMAFVTHSCSFPRFFKGN